MFVSPVFWQIRELVQSLTKKNLKSSLTEINQLVGLYGFEAKVFQLHCLIESLNLDRNEQDLNLESSEYSPKLALLQHELNIISSSANFMSILGQAFELSDQVYVRSEFSLGESKDGNEGRNLTKVYTADILERICSALNLGVNQQFSIGLALVYASKEINKVEASKFTYNLLKEYTSHGIENLNSNILKALFEFLNNDQIISLEDARHFSQKLLEMHRQLINPDINKVDGSDANGNSSAMDISLIPLYSDNNNSSMNFLSRIAASSTFKDDLSLLSNPPNSDMILVGFLKDLGPACSFSQSIFRDTLVKSGTKVSEQHMAQLLIMLMKDHKATGADIDLSITITSNLLETKIDTRRENGKIQNAWDLEVIRQVIMSDYASQLNWISVAREFDHKNFNVPDQMGLTVLLQLYRSAAKIDIPWEIMFGKWSNKKGQLSLLRACISAPPQLFSFIDSPRKQETLDNTDAAAAGTPNEAWLSLDLIALLLSLAQDVELYATVKEIFAAAAYTCPELLTLGLATVPAAAGGQLRRDLLTRLLPKFFRPNTLPTLSSFLKRLFSVNPLLLTSSCEEAFHADSAALPVVMHILKISKIVPELLPLLLSSEDVPFAICLACAAYSFESSTGHSQSHFELEPWVSERLQKDGEQFAGQLLAFLRANVATAITNSEINERSQGMTVSSTLSIEALAECLRAVAGPAGSEILNSSTHLRAATQQVADTAQRIHPHIVHLLGMVPISPPKDVSVQKQKAPNPSQKPAETSNNDVMEIANAYFQKLYTNEQSIPDMLEVLKRYQLSEDKTEQNIFAVMIQNLFDEYRFFTKYPEKELRITGILFGKLIKHGLVSSITLGIALRYVLEALSKPPGKDADGRMFRFGMFALENFKDRLGEWPQYCQQIVLIPHLAANFPELVREIERLIVQQDVSDSRISGKSGGSQYSDSISLAFDSSRKSELDIQNTLQQRIPQQLFQAEQLKTRQNIIQPPGNYNQLRNFQSYDSQSAKQSARDTVHDIASREAQLVQQMQMIGIGGAPAQKIESRQVVHEISGDSGSHQSADFVGRITNTQESSIFSRVQFPSQSVDTEMLTVINDSAGVRGSQSMQSTQMSSEALSSQAQHSDLDAPDIESIMMSVKEPTDEPPPDAVMDKIHFIINNVSPGNLEQKVNEISIQINGHPEFYAWMANYLVVKRISTQPNFHGLYLQFIDLLDKSELAEAVLKSVFFNVGKLLRSSKIITSTSERSLLKNLGSWLGQTTIARNKPILQRQLDLKELLFRGYESGRLIAVTPFVAKVLEGAQSSVVFQPPNPWLMGLLSALHEMYDLEDLKMNIKFEVEMLLKKLNIRLEDVPKYGRLAKRKSPVKDKNPDFNVRSSANLTLTQSSSPPVPGFSGHGGAGASMNAFAPVKDEKSLENAFAIAPTGILQSSSSSGDYTVIPNLSTYVMISENLELFEEFPQLKRFVPLAIDRAIREIIQPVVERSVTIAGITTKEIILKDFAMEGDENKLRKASHLMVSSLAGSLALVTCKEPLRVAIGSYLRTLCLEEIPKLDVSKLELVVQMTSTENLELGCVLIEKAATEKAMRDIDENLVSALQIRRKHRETSSQPFFDTSLLQSGQYPAALPEPLRLKPGGLQPNQYIIYEAFQRIRRVMSNRNASAVLTPQGASGSQMGSARVAPTSGGTGVQKIEAVIENAIMAWKSSMTRLEIALQMIMSQMANAGHNGELSLGNVSSDIELTSALHEIVAVGQRVPAERREEAQLRFAQNVFQRLFDIPRGKEDSATEIHLLRIEVYVAVLELCLRDVKRCPKDEVITRWYTQQPPAAMLGEGERKFQKSALTMFIRAKMIRLSELDVYIARAIENNGLLPELSTIAWAEFGMSLVRQCMFDPATQNAVGLVPAAIIKEFAHVLDALSRTSQISSGIKKQFDRLMIDLRMVAGQISHLQQVQAPSPMSMSTQILMQGSSDSSQANKVIGGSKIPASSRIDPAGVRDQVASILEYWVRLSGERPGDEKAYGPFLTLLQQRGLLKTDEATERFFRVATEVVVEACLKNARPPPEKGDGEITVRSARSTISYVVVDAYVKLLVLLIKSVNTGNATEAIQARLSLLNKVLSTIVRALLQDIEARKVQSDHLPPFDQRPYFRMLLGLLQDFNTPDRVLDSNNLQVLSAFASAFHVLQPIAAPSFAFAWLELISHRMFMPTLLLARQQKGWMLMNRLINDLLVFMEPRLRRSELGDAVRTLYRGMLRMLLVLLHDFPEFLCEYHFSLCDAIPPNCIQLRNLVLSAFPRSMRLPDPFTPNLKVDLLPEISQTPRILSNFTMALININLRGDIDKYLQSRSNEQFLMDLPSRLRLPPSEAVRSGSQYNVPAISALVVYIGHMAISQIQSKGTNITQSAPMDIYQHLSAVLDSEARYFFFNSIANQLRYPNNHTHYFSCVLLFLFAEATTEEVREQITRILLERLIVHRPHPWGLLITFIELIKNPRYDFWSHRFTHCAPELERVFESVARSCMTPSAAMPGPEGIDGTDNGPLE